MKTFKHFITECNNLLLEKFYLIFEKLNKTFDEDAHAKVWNYFISNPEYTEVRDALKSGNKERALELMRAELERARGESNHPLNFAKADDSEFAMTGTGKNKRANREDGDEETFNVEIEKAIGGVSSLATQKKFKAAVEKGFPARKTGASKAELSKTWSSAGGTNTTPKADIEVYDPDNEKNRRGISLKKEGGSQIASAEGGELKGTYKSAAKKLVKKLTDFRSKEERKKIEKEIMDAATRVADINDRARTADNDEKERLKNSGQEILDKLHDKYPDLTRQVTQVSTTGDEKFRGRNAPGSAGTIVTGDKAKPAQEQPSSRPRNAKPKDRGRPGNVKVDNRPGETKSNQAQPQQGPKTLKQFDREARTAELKSKGIGNERDKKIEAERERIAQEKEQQNAERRAARYAARKEKQAVIQHAQTAAELEQQTVQTANDLEAAKASAADATRVTKPDGTPVPRKNAFFLQNNPVAAQQHADKQAAAAQNVQAAQDAHDTAVTTHQTHLSTPPTPVTPEKPKAAQPTQPVPVPAPQPTQAPTAAPQSTQAPTTPIASASAPTQPQQTTQPAPQEDPKEKRKRALEQRMAAAAQRNNLE